MANPIKNLIDIVSGNIQDLRSSTYMTSSDERKQLGKLRSDIFNSIEDINNRTFENTGL